MKTFIAFDLMKQRIERSRQDSDTALFLDLLLFGELVTKAAVAGLVAAVDDDASRYQHRHRLVRADGIGEWGQVGEDVLTGPSSQHLVPAARSAQKDLTQRLGAGAWQYEATALMAGCLNRVASELQIKLAGTVGAKNWFAYFAMLRNKTKGHGAFPSPVMAELCPDLEHSLSLIAENAAIFQVPWAYLHRNMSGKYRVISLSSGCEVFDDYKKASHPEALANGVYVHWGRPVRLELVTADTTGGDLYFANGAFTDKRFEMVSYFTGEKTDGDSQRYLRPPGALPPSETEGLENLDVVNEVFSNMPAAPSEYIQRIELQQELTERLQDDANRIITLVGAGGIGKTSVTLRVLHQISATNRYSVILWFSARDIDLLPDGPRTVQPLVLTAESAAEEYVRLLQPHDSMKKGFDAVGCMSEALRKGADGAPTLFVFDNFETVRSPAEMFAWLAEHLRLPNKALITTRHREFRGDYPVPVEGMTEPEAYELINRHAGRLGVMQCISDEYRAEMYKESDGHPYVIKVLLGEVAKARRPVKVERIVASREDVLPALFERTFNLLSPAAQRVFLTLASWRSNIPQVALEAVLLRQQNERIDVANAVDELERYSFVEVARSESDDTYFLSVPLAASVFGERKLSVSPYKAAVEADRELLIGLGAGQKTDVRHGASQRIEHLFREIAKRLADGMGTKEEYLPVLEMIARKYPHAWLWLAKLHEELNGDGWIQRSEGALRNYLEVAAGADAISGWQRLADLSRRTANAWAEYHALVELCSVPGVSLSAISNAAQRINAILAANKMSLEQRAALKAVVQAFEVQIDRADADDVSRLAWLYLQLHEEDAARRLVRRAIARNPDNGHLQRLATRLKIA